MNTPAFNAKKGNPSKNVHPPPKAPKIVMSPGKKQQREQRDALQAARPMVQGTAKLSHAPRCDPNSNQRAAVTKVRPSSTFAATYHYIPNCVRELAEELSPLDKAVARMENKYLKTFPEPRVNMPPQVETGIEKRRPSQDSAIGMMNVEDLERFSSPEIETKQMNAEYLEDFLILDDENEAHPLDQLDHQCQTEARTNRLEIGHLFTSGEDTQGGPSGDQKSSFGISKFVAPQDPMPESVPNPGGQVSVGSLGQNRMHSVKPASIPYIPFSWPTPEVNRPCSPGSTFRNRHWRLPDLNQPSPPVCAFKQRHWRMHKGYGYKMRKHLIAMIEDEQALYMDKKDFANRKR